MDKFTIETAPQYERHYDEDKFWQKLRKYAGKWGEKLLLPAMTLYCMMKSPNVSLRDKALIAGALGYLILPLDAVPDFIPLLGITDDLTAIMLVIKTLNKHLTPQLRQEAKEQTDRLLKV
ncbi:MAG: DUF1232 domain-containing protein [Bacteroidales bacterium]|nr:DUF1232 domain-containing protein [Bacteroidales bacterium]